MTPTRWTRPGRLAWPRLRDGFTLTELLVVILIIVILSAAVLPAVLPAMNSRRVSEGSRLLQSEFARARDAAVRANAPRGFRLIPDPVDSIHPDALTSSRIVPIEPAPDYSDGMIQRFTLSFLGPIPPGLSPTDLANEMAKRAADTAVFSELTGNSAGSTPAYLPGPDAASWQAQAQQLMIVREVKTVAQTIGGVAVPLPSAPTSWYWNIRQGDKIQLAESGRYYTVIGPMRIGPNLSPNLASPDNSMKNPERYINFGSPATFPTGPGTQNVEFLILTNGQDDNGDGFTDEMFDGVNNDGDNNAAGIPIIDPGFNGVDDDLDGIVDNFAEIFMHVNMDGSFMMPGAFACEFEQEVFLAPKPKYGTNPPQDYSISRRPVPSEGAREILLPTNVVIDLTTVLANVPERSRVPIDPNSGFVDVLVAPNGQVVNAAAGTNFAPLVNFPFYHFWICERDAVAQPTAPTAAKPFRLPMPAGTGNDPRISATISPGVNVPTLKGERRLLSINTRTGAIVPTSVETFYLNNPSYPYEAAEAGVKDVQP